MPATPTRGGIGSVEYVVVRRDGLDGDEQFDDYDQSTDVTKTVNQILDRNEARQLSSDDDDLSDDDDDLSTDVPDGAPPPILFTMTLTQPSSQATGQALAESDPTETVVVSIPPPPPRPGRESGRISQTTEHLLIAAGSIGATIVVVMVVLGFYMMRKRGYSFGDAFREAKYRTTGRGAPTPPPKNGQAAWDSKKQYGDDYGAMRNDSVHAPQPTAVVARSGSLSSQRPAMPLGRSESFNTRTGSPGNVQGSFLLQDPPSRNNSHRRNNSTTPSSPVLPVQTHRQSSSTRNTRSIDDDASELQYSDPPQERPLSRLPPPPTFKQFLSNRPSISQRPGPGGAMISRFSWTNSNAPQTPHDPTRDTTSQIGRDSFMTSRSSVPRFRTIDSWVNQQTNRLEEQKLKEQFRLTQTSTVYSGDDDNSIPEVPDIPKDVAAQSTPPARGLPGRNIKHERHDTRTTVETAPIFRQHPGTEVRFSTRSVVPSEILDMGRKNTVLS